MDLGQSKNNKFWLWVFFLFYPLGAFIYSVKNYRFKEYRIFLFLFFLLYGYTCITIPESDGDDYKKSYININEYSFKNYSNDIQLVLNGKAANLDVYAQTIKFVSFIISPDYKIYFLLISFFYFLFLLKFLNTLWQNTIINKNHYYLAFFVGCFFVYNLYASISGIRFPLAFWVFSYGALNLILKDKLKYLLIASLSVAIHISLSYSLIFLYIFYFTRYFSNRNVLYIFLILALSFSFVFSTFINSYMDFFGNSIQNKVIGYTQEGYSETRENLIENWNWYVQFNLFATFYFCMISLILSKLKIFNLKFDSVSNKLFGFCIVLLIHSILSASIVDAVSNRYNILVILFTLAYFFYLSNLNRHNKLIKFLNYIYIPILIINILVRIRGDMPTINSGLIVGNVFTIFFIDVTKSIQELLFG